MANRSKSAVANGNCETFKSRRGGMPKRVVIGFHFVCPGEKGVTPNGDGTVWTGTWVVDREAALITIAGPLPAELHAHHRTMLHIVNAILTEPAILTKVNGERAITNHDMNRSFDAMDVEAVGSDHLPGEVATSAEAAHIAFEHKLLVCSNLMPDACSHERIDPFEVARAGDCSRSGALY
jgi:hypothetical protein